MDIKYCQHCGKELILKEIGDEGYIPYCLDCSKPYFKNPVCCVLVAVVNDDNEMLLIKQHYLSKEHWVLVAGYIQMGEDLEEAVYREVLEETGIETSHCKYIDSFKYDKKEMIMIGFIAYTKKKSFNLTSKEVDEIKWVDIENAPSLVRSGSIGQQLILKSIELVKKTN